MRLLFIINTPAQAYTWEYSMKEFLAKGHDLKILARDYGATPKILGELGFEFEPFNPIGSRSSRLLGAAGHFQRCYRLSRPFEPSLIVGFGLDAAVTAVRLRKPCIVFMDDWLTHVQNNLTHLLASAVITPDNLKADRGKRHVLVNSYKEMAYLHPHYFKPDATIFDDLKLEKCQRYVILRINAWDAIHDIGKHGFSVSDQFDLVEGLGQYARVFISPEGALPKELEKHRLSIPHTRIHHALYYAQLLITDTQTMATEAAVLGTPTVRSNTLVGPNDSNNFIELEQKYDLMYSFAEPRQAMDKAITLIKKPDLKEQWCSKRLKLLNDKTDLTEFMVDFIEGYPESLRKYQNSR